MGGKAEKLLRVLVRKVQYYVFVCVSYIVTLGRGVCPCCNSRVRFYKPYGTKKLRMNAECPYCRGAERDRIEALYFRNSQLSKSASVLHFAPERWLYDYFTKLDVECYYQWILMKV